MRNFIIPQAGTNRKEQATEIEDPNRRFGNKVEEVVKRATPNDDTYGNDGGLTGLGQGIQDAGMSGMQIEERNKSIQFQEENAELKRQEAEIYLEKSVATEDLTNQAKAEGWSSDVLQERIKDQISVKADSFDYEFATRAGDYRNEEREVLLESMNRDLSKPGGHIERYRLKKISESTQLVVAAGRERAQVEGTLSAANREVDKLKDHYSQREVIVAAGGPEAAENALHEAKEKMWVDDIERQILRNPLNAYGLITSKDKAEHNHYEDLDPRKRNRYMKIAFDANERNVKAKTEKMQADKIIEQVRRTGVVPKNVAAFKKAVNEKYVVLTKQITNLPPAERYMQVREFVNEYKVMPSSLKVELMASYNSPDDELVKATLAFSSDFIAKHPDLAKQLPDDLVTGTVMFQSGETIEGVRDTLKKARNLTVVQREALKTSYKDSKGKDKAESAAKSLSSDMSDKYFSSPTVSQAFKTEYSTMYEVNYKTTNGNHEAAQKLTNLAMQRVWGVTEVGGDERLMRYAPETLVSSGGNTEWIREQLDKDVYIATGIKLDGEYRLVPTVETVKDGKASYMVQSYDETGRTILLTNPKTKKPIVWSPDYEQTDDYQEAMDEAEDQALTQQEKEINAQLTRNYRAQQDEWKTQENIQKRARQKNQLAKMLGKYKGKHNLSPEEKDERDRINKEIARLSTAPKKVKIELPRKDREDEDTEEDLGDEID